MGKKSDSICVQHRHRIFLQEFLTASCRTNVLPELNCKKNRETGQYERHCQGDLQISVIKYDADVLQARGGPVERRLRMLPHPLQLLSNNTEFGIHGVVTGIIRNKARCSLPHFLLLFFRHLLPVL